MMRDGSRVITLIDQFDKVLDLAGITHNSHGDKYTLHSLRHFYAVLSLRRGIGVFDVARNMSTLLTPCLRCTVAVIALHSVIRLKSHGESWSRKSAQDDKWSVCLTAGTLCPANQEKQ